MAPLPFLAPQFRRLLYYRIFDWLMVGAIAGLAFALDLLPTFHRHFSLNDPTIRFPKTQGTVSSLNLTLISAVTPAVVIAVVALVIRRSFYDLHQAWLGLGISLSCTSLFIHLLKNTVGRPRPDFIDRCQPPANATDPPMGLSVIDICQQTDTRILYDGMKSFPSGHSAYCFAGLGFLSLYLAGKLHVFDQRGFVFKPLICLIPLLGAALVAVSRVDDYRHHWQDVTVGGLAGTFFAYFAYRLYYPSLEHSSCSHPFPPLAAGGNNGLPLPDTAESSLQKRSEEGHLVTQSDSSK